MGFPGGSVVKNPPANAGDVGLIPRLGRFPEGVHDNPIQYSFLENPMDRVAWWATVQGGHKKSETTEHIPMICINIGDPICVSYSLDT